MLGKTTIDLLCIAHTTIKCS